MNVSITFVKNKCVITHLFIEQTSWGHIRSKTGGYLFSVLFKSPQIFFISLLMLITLKMA